MIRPLAPLALVSLLACNTPPKEAHDGATTPAPPASASAPAQASAPAPAPASSSCTSDADCRLFSSYCAEAPCACRVLAARESDPRCLGDAASKVRCLVDPCQYKAAHCQGGACVLTVK